MSRWPDDACACQIAAQPCTPNCSCVEPFLSGGCLCCCRYGSDEQRLAMAEFMVEAMRATIAKVENATETD
jgi:hypothetical protein